MSELCTRHCCEWKMVRFGTYITPSVCLPIGSHGTAQRLQEPQQRSQSRGSAANHPPAASRLRRGAAADKVHDRGRRRARLLQMPRVPGVLQVPDGGGRQRVCELLRGGRRQDAVLAAPQHQHRRLQEAAEMSTGWRSSGWQAGVCASVALCKDGRPLSAPAAACSVDSGYYFHTISCPIHARVSFIQECLVNRASPGRCSPALPRSTCTPGQSNMTTAGEER